jgi:hypothetical protein
LQRRVLGHRRIADLTHGMFGRSPDHVASFVPGMVMKSDELKAPCAHAETDGAAFNTVVEDLMGSNDHAGGPAKAAAE